MNIHFVRPQRLPHVKRAPVRQAPFVAPTPATGMPATQIEHPLGPNATSVAAGTGRPEPLPSRHNASAAGARHRRRLALLRSLLDREDRGVAARPVRRQEAGPRVEVDPACAPAAHDRPAMARAIVVGRHRERVGRRKGVQEKRARPRRVGVGARAVDHAAVVDRHRAGRAFQVHSPSTGTRSRSRSPMAPVQQSYPSLEWAPGVGQVA